MTGTASPQPARGQDPELTQVLRPRLPPAERLMPYLRRIDATRVYSNWGPLASEFESRLADHFRLPAGGTVSASSGTAALVGAILASAGRATDERPLAFVPAFTFVATAAAVEQCGYRPYLVDIEAGSWMLDPERLGSHPELGRVGLAVPVAPYGRPVPQAQWRIFREQTGIPVVIDGAASFDRAADAPDRALGEIPVAISFHATKSFATGEGGCAAATDTDLILQIGQALNFGFEMTRESRSAAINGKMSEYHAAVGLAELDGWTEKRLALEAVADNYRRRLGDAGLLQRLVATPEIGASYILFRCAGQDEADRVRESMRSSGVDHRLWYGNGLQHHAAFAGLPREPLEITEELAPCLLGVPLAPDLADATVAHVVNALARGVEQRG